MMAVSDVGLESLHATATEIFTGRLRLATLRRHSTEGFGSKGTRCTGFCRMAAARQRLS